ncbi:hypothetical protein [Clostridium ganghwense]|uniref:Uncharacterized protein n=1 Tax=Clostridium ganghwense TaxID=312089 RepID=A0ABT4CPI4_9CLOT|nr:hypothetical protein [Clostridium ganghwense]MCY6370967.1 hypothetical protein [Clostridium ganghwense]
MKKRVKVLATLAIAGCVALGMGAKANAKTDAYLIKDKSTGTVYEFDRQALVKSFMNYNINGSDALYDDYKRLFSKNGLYAFHDDTKKYVDYEEVKKAFMDANINNKAFSLDDFTENKGATMTTVPKIVKDVTASNGKITYSDKDTGSQGAEDALEITSIE